MTIDKSRHFILVILGALISGCSHSIARPQAGPQNHMFAGWIKIADCNAVKYLKEIEKTLFQSGFVREPEPSEIENTVEMPEPFELQTAYLEAKKDFVTFTKSDFKRQENQSLRYDEIRNTYSLSYCTQKQGDFFVTVFRDDLEKGDRFWGKRFENALDRLMQNTGCKSELSQTIKDLGLWNDAQKTYYFRIASQGNCREYFSNSP